MSAPAKTSSAQIEAALSAEDPGLAASHSQIMFRQVNEETRRLADNSELDELQIVCECDHGDCLTQLSVPIPDYEAVRRFPTRFLVSPNHAGLDERIVHETSAYLAVEKVGPGAAAAIRHDPRKPPARAQTP